MADLSPLKVHDPFTLFLGVGLITYSILRHEIQCLFQSKENSDSLPGLKPTTPSSIATENHPGVLSLVGSSKKVPAKPGRKSRSSASTSSPKNKPSGKRSSVKRSPTAQKAKSGSTGIELNSKVIQSDPLFPSEEQRSPEEVDDLMATMLGEKVIPISENALSDEQLAKRFPEHFKAK